MGTRDVATALAELGVTFAAGAPFDADDFAGLAGRIVDRVVEAVADGNRDRAVVTLSALLDLDAIASVALWASADAVSP